MRWFVDGNNVMGSRPDGWWNDPAAAKARLTQEIAVWCRSHDDPVTVVFDRPVAPAAQALGGGNLGVEFAAARGRDAADDHLVALVDEVATTEPDLVVVTADRGLIERLPAGVATMGPRRFRDLAGC